MKNSKQGSPLGQVFLIVFIDLVGFSVIFPLVPHMLDHYLALEGPESFVGRLAGLLERIAGAGAEAGTEEGSGLSTIAVHALFGGFLGSLYSGLQFLFAPVWGAWSDRHGRRPTLLVTLAGTAASYLIWFFSGSFLLLVLARLFGGMMSGNISTVSAVIGDTTSGKDRAKGMGIIGMAVGLGFILGPALGGLGAMLDLTQDWPGLADLGVNPFSVPAGIAFGLSAPNLLWVAMRFRETLPPEKRGQTGDGRRPSLHPFRQTRELAANTRTRDRTPWKLWSYYRYRELEKQLGWRTIEPQDRILHTHGPDGGSPADKVWRKHQPKIARDIRS